MLGDVDPACGELRVADERFDSAPVLELEASAIPSRRLHQREPLEQLLGAVVELALDRDSILGGNERRPPPVHEVEAVARRRPRALGEACPGEVERSACLLVTVDPSSQERPPLPDAPTLPVEHLSDALRTLAEGGADEAILVASPITEASIRELGAALPR